MVAPSIVSQSTARGATGAALVIHASKSRAPLTGVEGGDFIDSEVNHVCLSIMIFHHRGKGK